MSTSVVGPLTVSEIAGGVCVQVYPADAERQHRQLTGAQSANAAQQLVYALPQALSASWMHSHMP